MVVVNGDDLHHDLIGASLVFQQLASEAGFATRRAAGMNRFVDARVETAETDVFLLYTAGGSFATEQQRALADAVAAGKGIVALHGSNILGWDGDAVDPADRPFFDLLGNRYLSHGPGHHEGRHTIEVVSGHPVTDGLGDFELFDEYYEFELSDEAITVLARRRRADGVVVPVAYARRIGEGRVAYIALGHDMRAWGEPSFRTLVKQALVWAAGETT